MCYSPQQCYDWFACGYAEWEEEAEYCLCRGSGWALSNVDTWHPCPVHNNGQPHPEMDMYDHDPPTVRVIYPIIIDDACVEDCNIPF